MDPEGPLRLACVPDRWDLVGASLHHDVREAFAADLPAERTALMAATQRPVAAAAFSDASGPPVWKRLPSWAVVATGDKAAGSDVVRSMAWRAGADIMAALLPERCKAIVAVSGYLIVNLEANQTTAAATG